MTSSLAVGLLLGGLAGSDASEEFEQQSFLVEGRQHVSGFLCGHQTSGDECLLYGTSVFAGERADVLTVRGAVLPAADGGRGGLAAHALRDLVRRVISGVAGDFAHVFPPSHVVSVRRTPVLLRGRASDLRSVGYFCLQICRYLLSTRIASRKNEYNTQHRSSSLLECTLTTTALPESRPFWLTFPCPSWCTEDHCPGDPEDQRFHTDKGATVTLHLHDSVGELNEPQVVHVSIGQGYREAEPYVELYAPVPNALLKLTVAEAAALAGHVLGAVRAASDGGQRLTDCQRDSYVLDSDEADLREIVTYLQDHHSEVFDKAIFGTGRPYRLDALHVSKGADQ